MTRRLLLTTLLALACVPAVSAQRPKDDDAFVAEKPTIGDPVPDLTVYDADGKEVKLSSLRGHHAVLVFGCLT